MILKASERGGGRALATHLMRTDENDHIELHELRGFVADDLHGALQEAYGISRGTKCKRFLFSVSLNPPPGANVPIEAFEKAIDDIEAKVGLGGQPRAIVFHEKENRRHAHCVWSKIDGQAMKAINLSHFKLKLQDIARQLFIEHNWQMPMGLVRGEFGNPKNFTRAEWQQAKRTSIDPRTLKGMFQNLWHASDSKGAFTAALEERGFVLARGDRKTYVAVDFRGEIYSIARMIGRNVKSVRDRLSDPALLPSVAQAKEAMAKSLRGPLRRYVHETEEEVARANAAIQIRKRELVSRQRAERTKLEEAQVTRANVETRERASRFRPGLVGLWDRLTGRHKRTRSQNEIEARQGEQRDRTEKEEQIGRHVAQRRGLQREIESQRTRQNEILMELRRDLAECIKLKRDPPQRQAPEPQPPESLRQRQRRRFGPTL